MTRDKKKGENTKRQTTVHKTKAEQHKPHQKQSLLDIKQRNPTCAEVFEFFSS